MIRAFGWMLPAIAISVLLGTGPNAVIMALALPLGQTALSLAIDKVWGRTSNRAKPRYQTKKRPSSQAARNTGMNEEKRGENKDYEGRETYKSQVGAPEDSVKNSKTASSFGGWDELDKEGVANKIPRRGPDGAPRQQKKGKLSRRRNQETPLLLRLLIAVFPLLGSWTKLL